MGSDSTAQDKRFLACNGRVAAAELAESVSNVQLVEGEVHQCSAPVTTICATPGGGASCQLVFGQNFRVLETRHDWCFGQCVRDGYVGYAKRSDLGAAEQKSHWVCSLGSGLYTQESLKSPLRTWLPFGSRVLVEDEKNEFVRVAGGDFIPRAHIIRLKHNCTDFVAVAEMFLHCPYLWGGNTLLGIDCSGLVQVALTACGIACPRDSDLQSTRLGKYRSKEHAPKRGDLAFWQGHVGIMADEQTLLHASAHSMRVVLEPFDVVLNRIQNSEGDTFIGLKELN